MSQAPDPVVLAATGETRAVALVLPGGKAHSFEPWAPGQLAALRMRPFSSHLHRAGSEHGLEVRQLGYQVRGWNGDAASPVADARWALDEVRRQHGELPFVLVGHSMGGRIALRLADDSQVKAVVALAPWIEPTDSVEKVRGRGLLIAHGDIDVITSRAASEAYARSAAQITSPVARFKVRGEMHAMLFRWNTWHKLTTGFALASLGFAPMPKRIEKAIAAGRDGNFAVPC